LEGFFCVKIMKPAKIKQIFKDLFFITLNPPINGFDDFIGVWVKTGTPSYIVDVGPAVTVTDLKQAMDELDQTRLDFILITHIHMDHAGGIGDFSKLFPKTPIICHKSAIPHMVDPTRLWNGSLKTLGNMARAYGPLTSVNGDLLVDAEHFADGDITPLITPGHAPHHVSFMTPQCLFAGETCGVHLTLPGGNDYLRPATPPKFFLETSLASIDRLIEKDPRNICFGHHGMEEDGVSWLKTHKKQLFLWKNIVEEEMAGDDDNNGSNEGLFSRCIERFKQEDPLLANFNLLSPGKKDRETYFITNSIKGFKGYIESKNP
jgi:glyoxylase-like metal-dependent hydrolase (beta-lactamase superfamily II)